MKKETSGGGSKNPKPKISEPTPLKATVGDDSWLIGGIVEKGFSNIPSTGPLAAPQLTVLPFPVARHRSHGPHWAPIGVKNGNDDMDDDVEEVEDYDGMEMAAGVAKPVERKEKKGLDFSGRLQSKNEKKNEIGSTVSEVARKAKEIHLDDVSKNISGPDETKLSRTSHVDHVKEPFMTKDLAASGFVAHKSIGGEKESLESQIDAENRARLEKMSVDEIAEARYEITEKLNPALMNALKLRGQSKVKRQKISLPHVNNDEADNMQHEKIYLAKKTAGSVKLVPGDIVQDKDDTALRNKSPENRSLWDAWSKRVENVRDVRFSLDGNVIGSESGHVSDTGKASSELGYNTNNVTERDFVRTEGDPGAAGYTIQEAVVLTRSVFPGQRALALHLIASVLDKSIDGICQNEVDSSSVDWEAIWAFALGPEPELALALRMSLDHTHSFVVLACAKAIQCALSCDMNDTIFDILEKTPTYAMDVCTAPVFRSRPDVNTGFLRGGFWKYNTKPSNIRSFGDDLEGEKDEGERTIQDDVFVSGQDFAAGLVRMGILSRICYLLEDDPPAQLEECLISILIAIARHSPTCAAAILDCERLIPTIVDRFAMKEQMEINLCKIKSVTFLKVLARVEKKNCSTFINKGIFHKVTWHLYRYQFSLDQWVKSGKESCKLSSALLVEQLRLWKVSISYGYCISEFPNLFASLYIWLSVPTFEKLIANDIIDEYCAVAKEAYLLLDVLACRLPNFYGGAEKADRDEEPCSWNFFGSIIDLAIEWIKLKSIPHVSKLFNCGKKDDGEDHILHDSELNSSLWVISSVLNMFSSLLKALTPMDITTFPDGRLPWLPEFVPRVGLEIIKNGYLRYHLSENVSLIEFLCLLRTKNRTELGISSTCCLQGLVQVVDSIDKLIRHANLDVHKSPSKYEALPKDDKVLANGILKSCVVNVRYTLTNLMKFITKEWQLIRPVEVFGRGGPAPGVGAGWGTSGGGYWAANNFLAQQDARLLVYLLEITEIPFTKNPSEAMQMLNCALTACLVVGPGNYGPVVVGKLLKFIFRVPVLKYLDSGIRKFLSGRKGYKSYTWSFEDDEYRSFASLLGAHFRNRWLSVKKKKSESTKKEELSSLRADWARQRLPLPAHWFLSAIATIHSEKKPSDFLEVNKSGLFFLLGVEALPNSPAKRVPIVWKLHSMSVLLLSGMEILGDEKSRDVYEILQNVYGEIVDEEKPALSFGNEISKNYETFIEALVEQFAAESYGDSLFGRQVAMYLHRSVGASVRVAAWNALSNALVLELLPPVDKCFTRAEGFLEPVEDNERILEAYVKSWVSGALDKAANRNSVTFLLVLHHLSSFIFGDVSGDMLPLRNKLVKSLIRDYSRKHQHEGMMVKLICYTKPNTTLQPVSEIEKRIQLLKDNCDGLVTEVEKLESCIRKELN